MAGPVGGDQLPGQARMTTPHAFDPRDPHNPEVLCFFCRQPVDAPPHEPGYVGPRPLPPVTPVGTTRAVIAAGSSDSDGPLARPPIPPLEDMVNSPYRTGG